jgi:hypothetical protein
MHVYYFLKEVYLYETMALCMYKLHMHFLNKYNLNMGVHLQFKNTPKFESGTYVL